MNAFPKNIRFLHTIYTSSFTEQSNIELFVQLQQTIQQILVFNLDKYSFFYYDITVDERFMTEIHFRHCIDRLTTKEKQHGTVKQQSNEFY